MTIGVLALMGLAPERVAALTAAGYAVREGKKYANRIDAVREAGDTVRAVLTNGRGGLSGDEMAWLPNLEIVCTGSAGYEAVDLDTARRRGIVVAHCPDANAPAVAGSPYRYFDRLIELATWADFLICAAPGGAGTRYLVNADVLTALGPQGYLVNVGRGTVVDTQALIDALRSQRIAGAGLDVLEGEPSVPPLLPELLQCDHVVVTPHVAGRAPESRTAATALILSNLNAYFAGKPLLSPVSFKG
jgi:lactate dehydrogenase-like 2-hydroxyacid dehydrogenase